MYKKMRVLIIAASMIWVFTGCGKKVEVANVEDVQPVGVEDIIEKEEFVDNNQINTEVESDGLEDIDSGGTGEDETGEESGGVTKEDLYSELVKGGGGKVPKVKGDSKTIEKLKDQIANTTEESVKAEAEKAEAEKAKSETKNNNTKKDTGKTANKTTNKGVANSNNTYIDDYKPDKAVKKRTDRAAVNLEGIEIVTAIEVNSVKRGKKAVEVLEKAEEENGASFGTASNSGYDIVVVNFTVKLPSNIVNYLGDCIPDVRVRGTDGKMINGEAIYVYTGELGDYSNDGRSKTYDIVFEIPKSVSKYSIQFGIYEADNYVWYSK